MSSTHFHTCPLCEATCGLAITTDGTRVTDVVGDAQDVFSKGYACPKGLTIGELHDDPDRLTAPLVDGQEVTWDEAWQAVADRVGAFIDTHGREALALFLGNPNVHGLAGAFYTPAVAKAAGTKHVFTASTVDQQPKHVSSALMFGHKLSVPIPDVDHTDYLLVLGADPMASNGSLMTAPDMPGRLRALKKRGGRLVVVDPRVSTTARTADEHLAIRPGTDALWLAAICQTLLEEGLAATDVPHVANLDRLPEALAPFTPEAVDEATRIPADVTRRIARELAASPTAAVYGRMGTCTVAFGATTSWLVDVVNILTGNLDRPGGVLFTKAAAGQTNSSATGRARATTFGRYSSSVRDLPEFFSEMPSAALAEEIHEGPIKGLITIAGNPALSVPNADRVNDGLAGLDLMICIDPYLNETTRHADIVLPVPSVLEREHMDVAFTQLAIRNVINWSDALFDSPVPPEWETQSRLAGILQGMGADVDPADVDMFILSTLIQKEVGSADSPIAGRDQGEIMAELEPRRGPERIADFLVRVGPYGDGFGADPDGLTLEKVQAEPHGIDLGPLQPRMPEVLLTEDGLADAAPEMLLGDLPRLAAFMESDHSGLRLVGRRHLRSNNSWGHNVASLVGGTNRSTLQIHPDDADGIGLADGGQATVASAHGKVTATVEVTKRISPGTVSLPHGWGHDVEGVRLSVAKAAGGVNPNVLTGPEVDPMSGNAILNGVPVEVSPA